MTDVRTFRAATMQAALDLVRREMGADAVILHTRQVPVKRLLPWGKPKEEVEITAGLGVNVRPIGARLRDEGRPAQTENKRQESNSRPAPSRERAVETETPATPRPPSWSDRVERRRRSEANETSELQLSPPKSLDGVEIAISSAALSTAVADAASVGRTNRAAPTLAASAAETAAPARPERRSASRQAPPRRERPERVPSERNDSPAPARTPTSRPPRTGVVTSPPRSREPRTSESQPAAKSRSVESRSTQRPESRPVNAAPVRPSVREPRAKTDIANDPSAAFAERLDSIERLLEQLGRRVQSVGGDEIPSEVFDLYTELIDRNVEDGLARRMAIRLKEHCTPEQLADPAACRSVLTAMIESDLRCALPITPVRGRRTVVALVGATGVGKTTTIAKLAANFRLRDGIRMGLVTVDTYRIAAVEQLRTYAEIIDLPMRVVTNPLEMRQALDEMTGLDLILIDTAGRSPRDEVQIQELRQLLAEADVDQVHLVLSMTASHQSLAQSVEKFAPVRISSVILTKLDEATGLGPILTLAHKYQTPVSYLTTGQDVPDDLEPASPSRLARLILGSEEVCLDSE